VTLHLRRWRKDAKILERQIEFRVIVESHADKAGASSKPDIGGYYRH
jgi:hypothetical protein